MHTELPSWKHKFLVIDSQPALLPEPQPPSVGAEASSRLSCSLCVEDNWTVAGRCGGVSSADSAGSPGLTVQWDGRVLTQACGHERGLHCQVPRLYPCRGAGVTLGPMHQAHPSPASTSLGDDFPLGVSSHLHFWGCPSSVS